jgi:hypothetical protein
MAFVPSGTGLAVLFPGETALRLWRLDRLRKRLGDLGLDWEDQKRPP